MASTLTLASGQVVAYHLASVTPHAPTVVLANPLAAPFTFWDPIISLLTCAGFSVLRYNQPGHGDSTAPSPSTTTFAGIASAVHELLELLQITSAHAWIGVSMGAATGVVFATQYPGFIRKLVICDTIECSPVNVGQPDAFTPRVEAARTAGSLTATVSGTMERWFGTQWMETHPAEAARLQTEMLTTTIDGYAACCAALASDGFDLRPLYERVGSSVEEALLVVGERDGDLPTVMEGMRERIQAGFQNGNQVVLRVVPNAGHVSFVDGQESFMAAVVPFLQA